MRSSLVAAILPLVAACGHSAGSPGDPDDPPVSDGQNSVPPSVRIETITDEHRAIPGAMFGGWGPHLGHLLRLGEQTYWVDDACSPKIAGDCSVDVDRRVAVLRRDPEMWTAIGTLPLPGVQQNTAALVSRGKIYVYGVASAAQRIVECTFDVATAAGSCTQLAISTGASANYVGASIAPNGSRVVWWTNVADGGGGSWSYIVDYGGGFNGPRAGAVGGYNDCGYAHVAFAGASAETFCEVTTGLAPKWTFSTLVGSTTATLATPVAWGNALAAPAGDRVLSTNDLVADGDGSMHLIARSANGAALIYAKPAGGAYGAPDVLPQTFRARWVATTAGRVLVRDVDRHDLMIGDQRVTLPAGFGDVYAIYPLSPAYQDTAIPRVEVAVVGSGEEHRALYVTIE